MPFIVPGRGIERGSRADDTTADYLVNKIVAGSAYLTLAETTPAGDEDLTIDVANLLTTDAADIIAATDAGTLLTVNQSGTGAIVDLQDGGTSRFQVADDGLLTHTVSLDDATGDEVGFSISPTVNKITSGNYTALKIAVVETAAILEAPAPTIVESAAILEPAAEITAGQINTYNCGIRCCRLWPKIKCSAFGSTGFQYILRIELAYGTVKIFNLTWVLSWTNRFKTAFTSEDKRNGKPRFG